VSSSPVKAALQRPCRSIFPGTIAEQKSFAALKHPQAQIRHLYPFLNWQRYKIMYRPQLENIKVAAPCTAEWRHMYGNDRVRFCNQCKLYVYNLSAMPREQAEDLIRSAEGKLCVRFYQRTDGTIITQNCPQGLQALKEKFNRTRAKIAAALLTFLGSMGILWLAKPEPPSIVMGNISPIKEQLPVVGLAKNNDPPTMGKIQIHKTLERSEQFIRNRATFKSTPIFHSATSLQNANSQVVVNISISPEGKVTQAQCLSENPSVRQIAEAAAYRWTFQPVEGDGLPVTIKSKLTFRFSG
jgi:hypothetical protein